MSLSDQAGELALGRRQPGHAHSSGSLNRPVHDDCATRRRNLLGSCASHDAIRCCDVALSTRYDSSRLQRHDGLGPLCRRWGAKTRRGFEPRAGCRASLSAPGLPLRERGPEHRFPGRAFRTAMGRVYLAVRITWSSHVRALLRGRHFMITRSEQQGLPALTLGDLWPYCSETLSRPKGLPRSPCRDGPGRRPARSPWPPGRH